MKKGAVKLKKSRDGDAGYLYFPDHPGPGAPGSVKRIINLRSLVENYRGPEIYMDFDAQDRLIGIEFLLEE